MEEYDFLVVGSGSGLDVADAAASRGLSVAVVESGPLGGTCLNRGCIPSKRLLYHADVRETVARAEEFHLDVTVADADVGAIVREVTEAVDASSDAIRRGLRASDAHALYEGLGRFVGERTVEVSEGPDAGATLRAERVLVATGSRPAIPPIDGLDGVDYLTSTEALRLERPPDHLLVVGGGYVAAELAHFFGTFGSDVTIVGRRPTLVPEADREVATAFTERYADRFTVHVGHAATAATTGDGEITVTAHPYEYEREDGDEHANAGSGADDGRVVAGDPVTATGDALLVAAGRVPNTDRLNPAAAGIATDDRGFVETDDYLRTTAADVWALGDVVGEYLLKHAANHEARAVVRDLFGESEPIDYSAMPFAVFASPEVAGVGAREADLRAEGRAYGRSVARYEDTARGRAMRAEGLVKALVGPDGAILGAHVVGPDASALVQEVVVAMRAGAGVGGIRDAVHVHPALPEVVHRAFAGPFTWEDHDRAGPTG
jgi:dihydrolipoamide dehydrogenase